jgi:hypothetical protein
VRKDELIDYRGWKPLLQTRYKIQDAGCRIRDEIAAIVGLTCGLGRNHKTHIVCVLLFLDEHT